MKKSVISLTTMNTLLYFQNEINTDELSQSIEKINNWGDYFMKMWPNILAAIVTLILFYLIAWGARKLINNYLVRFTNNKAATNIVALTIFCFILFTGLMLSLSFLTLDKAFATFLAGAGIIGIALGFALQETAANFISGIFMAFKSNFKEGDYIETNDLKGIVEKMDLRSTKMKTLDGHQVIIPNKDIFQKPLINYNHYSSRMVDLVCGIAYDSDLDLVEKTSLEVINKVEGIKNIPSPQFFYTSFGDHSIQFTLRFWVDFLTAPDYLEAQHIAIKELKKAFDTEGIEIPFPITTVKVSSTKTIADFN